MSSYGKSAKSCLIILFAICLLSGSATSDDAVKEQVEYPYLSWRGSHAGSGEFTRGRVTSPDITMIRAKLEELDWSGKADKDPYLVIVRDMYAYIRIELAGEKGNERARVACLKILAHELTEENKNQCKLIYRPRSKPLKDNDHILNLLNAYLKNDKEFESLAEWETKDGKLPTTQSKEVFD